MTIESQIARFESAVDGFLAAVRALREEDLLAPINGWTPRDIAAHLIGWNRHVIEGSRQIARGELPFYDLDPGDDYGRVNRELIRLYRSRDREELCRELRVTAGELRDFLSSLDAAVWARDHGVRHAGAVVTIRGTVDELIADYDHHRAQLEARLASPGHDTSSPVP